MTILQDFNNWASQFSHGYFHTNESQEKLERQMSVNLIKLIIFLLYQSLIEYILIDKTKFISVWNDDLKYNEYMKMLNVMS